MKKHVISTLLAFATSSVLAEYPDQPITIVVPFAVGGTTDRLARDLALAMQKSMGNQPILIENVGGDGGALGANKVAKAAPDGYTLLIHQVVMASRPALKLSTPYSLLDDFEYLGMFAEVPMVLVGRPTLPATTYTELTKWLEANKGRIKIGNAGAGSPSHLCGQLFQASAKIDMTPVPYKGTGPAIADVMAGELDLLCEQTSSIAGQIRTNKVKAYAVTMSRRITEQGLQMLPTLNEVGLQGFNVSVWHALSAPNGTPSLVTNKLNGALRAAARDASFVQRVESYGAMVVTDARLSGVEHKRFVEAEIAKWDQVINATGQYADSGRALAATTGQPSVSVMTGTDSTSNQKLNNSSGKTELALANAQTAGAGQFSSRYSFGPRGFKPMSLQECQTAHTNINMNPRFFTKRELRWDEVKQVRFEDHVAQLDAFISLYSGPCANVATGKGMLEWANGLKKQAVDGYRKETSKAPPQPSSDDRPCSQRMPWLPAHTCQ